MITRNTDRGAKTKQRIVEAALGLFVSQGVAATTTRDIAERAEIAEGTIYRHFESKEALAMEIFLEGFLPYSKFLQQLEKADGDLLEKIEKAAGQFYRLFDADPTLWMYIMTYQTGEQSKVPAGTPTPYSVLLALLKKGARKGEIGKVDPALGVQMLLGMIQYPALGIIYGELAAPVLPRLPEVMAAIRRFLSV